MTAPATCCGAVTPCWRQRTVDLGELIGELLEQRAAPSRRHAPPWRSANESDDMRPIRTRLLRADALTEAELLSAYATAGATP
jgi:hypothetical protein